MFRFCFSTTDGLDWAAMITAQQSSSFALCVSFLPFLLSSSHTPLLSGRRSFWIRSKHYR